MQLNVHEFTHRLLLLLLLLLVSVIYEHTVLYIIYKTLPSVQFEMMTPHYRNFCNY